MNFEIIDFHMHPFLDNKDNINIYQEVIELSPYDIKNDLESAGISKFCGSIIKADNECENSIRNSNLEALKLKEIYDENYIPGFQVNPMFLEKSLEEVKFAHENNVKIIGEIVPWQYGWDDYSNDRFSIILDEIAKNDMVVSLHTENLEQMCKMAKTHPEVKFVFAHPGEKNVLLQHINTMKQCDNVFIDLSGTGIFRYGTVKKLISDVGAERILFGTDYPICNPFAYVGAVIGEKISDREKELIFSGNAKRLLKIQ